MFSKKNIFLVSFLLISMQIPVFADEVMDLKVQLQSAITKLVQHYETRIRALETENDILRKEIATLKGAVPSTTSANTPSTGTITTTSTGTTTLLVPMMFIPTTPKWEIENKTETYNKIVDQINTNLPSILSENSLSGSGTIGLFEFIEPNVFFISIDDGKNPTGVMAFKTKILYTYDTNFNLTKIGLFDLDYTSQKYRTVFGTNPYSKSQRTRVPNPLYKGKLLLISTVSSTGSTINTTTVNITPSDVTFADIKAAYDKNKLLDALKLSEGFIAKNPNDMETLKIRYRSYYIVGKYEESLAEIKKIESLQGTAFDRAIACDGAVIAKISKKTDISTYYSAICKKK